MNILIVGYGYAGKRFFKSIEYVANMHNFFHKLNCAYVDKVFKNVNLPYYSNLSDALHEFAPDLVIVTVNDEYHAEILNELKNYKGFVLCEKPLSNNQDDLNELVSNLSNISGFCFDMIERYSIITKQLKEYVSNNNLKLVRADFHWGKNRINDYRPTCGVTSEVIHALDLIQYMISSAQEYSLDSVLGTCSDFSISGTKILDSVMLTAYLKQAVITGYSSFVNILRKREINLTLIAEDHTLIYAHMVFDTPQWDIDYLRIWDNTLEGERIHLETHTKGMFKPELQTIQKLACLVEDVLLYILYDQEPKQPFPSLNTAIRLQKLLNTIDLDAKVIGPVRYITGPKREFLISEDNLEALG